MNQQASSATPSNHRLFPTWFWVLSLGLVFVLSVVWHLPVAPFLKNAQAVLPTSVQNLSFENSQGSLWEGATQLKLQLSDQSEPVDLGRLEWQQPAGDLLSALSPQLLWQTQFGHWQGEVERGWLEDSVALNTQTLQIDIQNLLNWLSPFVRVPFEVKGEVSSQQLRLQWSPKQLVTALDGKAVISNLATMGISMPPITLQASMPDTNTQQITWQISGQGQGWNLQGNGTLQAKPGIQNFGVYQGEVLVTAQTAEQLPDFAHLLRSVSPTSAKLILKGNLNQLRM